MIHLLAEPVFESLQGEAVNNGKPSIFIRFFGCNLDCWFCDSRYSYKIKEADIIKISTEDIVKEIKKFYSKHIIWTGGEITLFQKNIKEIMKELGSEYTHELETNGSNKLDDDIFFDQINISPKLKSSKNPDYELKILEDITLRCYNYIFKFVCSDLITTKETEECIKKYNIDQEKVYIMPEGRDVKSQINQYIIQYCIKKGYNYCLRSHLILFGDGKGK